MLCHLTRLTQREHAYRTAPNETVARDSGENLGLSGDMYAAVREYAACVQHLSWENAQIAAASIPSPASKKSRIDFASDVF